jgi:uncharacterized protein (TIGR03086 family)
MATDHLDLYERTSTWTLDKVKGARDHLEDSTPCDEWDVRTLLNHMLDTQRYFLSSGRGEDASPPSPEPPDILSADPAADFENVQQEMLQVFSDPEVVEKTGPALGIAFADQLVHGWDVARATGQDAHIPESLAQGAYDTIHGKFTDEQRQGMFKPEIEVGPDASAQEKLLAYTGRSPD